MAADRTPPGGGFPITVLEPRRFLVLAEGALGLFRAKTAVGLIRYRGREVVGILDSKTAGRALGEVLGIDHPAPIVDARRGLRLAPDTLLIGIAHARRRSEPWRAILVRRSRPGST
jgi:uncharacterized NAD-dependent epimerase/dehydratase family protein